MAHPPTRRYSFHIYGQFIMGMASKWQGIYERAGSKAKELLTLTRLVKSSGTYDREVSHFNAMVSEARDLGQKEGRKFGQ